MPIIFLLFATLFGTPGSATSIAVQGQAPGESRTHYVIASRDRTPVQSATVISTTGENLSTETYLFENAAGQRVRIEVRRNYSNGRVTAEYTVNGTKPVHVKFQLPVYGVNRAETMRQYKAHPELASADVPVTIEHAGGAVETSEKRWKAPNSEVPKKTKAVLGAQFVDAIAPFRTILAFPQFGGACSTFEFVSGQKCVADPSIMIAADKPDCDFDAKFGLPCDAAQKARATQQPKNGRVGNY